MIDFFYQSANWDFLPHQFLNVTISFLNIEEKLLMSKMQLS